LRSPYNEKEAIEGGIMEKRIVITGANLRFEEKLWQAADKLRNNMDAAEYRHVVLGLISLKYISDPFEEHRKWLEIETRNPNSLDYDYKNEEEEDHEPFEEKMKRLTSKLSEQFTKSAELEQEIKKNLKGLGFWEAGP